MINGENREKVRGKAGTTFAKASVVEGREEEPRTSYRVPHTNIFI
ncbi:MAG: hypothetical protein WAW07_06920 [Bacteroidales bacterium]